MRIFRTALALIARHRAVFAIYVLILSLLGYFMAGSVGGAGTSAEYAPVVPKAAVIDRDGSDISRAISAHVAGMCEMIEVEDSTFGLQDAAARDLASYVLVIPEGYGEALLAAARAGADAPDMECVVSYQSGRGSIVDARVRAYARQLYAFAAAKDGVPVEQLIAWTDEVQASGVSVEQVEPEQAMLPTSYLVYCQFATYPLFGGVAVVVASGLAGLQKEEMRRRLAASSVSEASQAGQAALAIFTSGVLVWAVNAVIGLVLFRHTLVGVPVEVVALALFSLLALAFVGSAFGFLLWQVGASLQVSHAAANIGAMVLTFLGGTWVSIDQMGEATRMAAQLTPCYWAVSALTELARTTSLDAGVVATVLGDAALVVLFAAALAAVALVAGRLRSARGAA